MVINNFFQFWMKRRLQLSNRGKKFLDNVLHTRHMNRQFNRGALGLLQKVFSFMVIFSTISSIDESCNLMILFKPSGNSKLLQMDSFWPELHDHSNGWDSEGSGFSLVLSNGKENREKLFSVVL